MGRRRARLRRLRRHPHDPAVPRLRRPRTQLEPATLPRCALDTTLAQLRTEGDPHAIARLTPLLARLEQHDKPRSALSWLERSPAAPTLRAMLRGEIAISHEALDEHDA
jgi:hypothetical protein